MEDPNIMYLIQAFQAELAVSQDDYVTTNNWIEQFDKSLIPPMITFYYPLFTLLKIFFKQDTEERRMQAFDILNRLKDFAESSHNKNYLIKILVWEALFQKSSGDEVSALSALKQALNLAKPGGFVRLFMAQEPCLSNLLQKLDNHHNPFIEQISNTLEEDVGYTEANNSLIVPLTDRELNVLAFLIKRLTNKEIAGQLNISTGTVKSHTIRIYQKLSVNNRREAVGKALSIGLKLR
jgi:LuxR family maltose regulon positive regulatory protein